MHRIKFILPALLAMLALPSLGLAPDSSARIKAAIGHVLQSAREEGHCYLTKEQILEQVQELIALNKPERVAYELKTMEQANELKTRHLPDQEGQLQTCYYALSLYFDENFIDFRCRRFVHDAVDCQNTAKH